jgi:hypothetical protein
MRAVESKSIGVSSKSGEFTSEAQSVNPRMDASRKGLPERMMG